MADRTADLAPDRVQEGNRTWWNATPMAYDWRGEIDSEPYTEAWFAQIDAKFVFGSRLFAHNDRNFGRIIPFDQLAGKRVLEIGCGMGLHTSLMAAAGADVTAVDLTPTAVQATKKRLALKGLTANVIEADAEKLPFADASFDFVWSWGVIHHSAHTGRIVKEISRVLAPDGEVRVMVYNRESGWAMGVLVRDHWFKGGFLKRTYEETLYKLSDGFTARFYVQEQFEDLFRTFFDNVSSELMGQDSDVVPLPPSLRNLIFPLLSQRRTTRALASRGSFIFLTARR